MHLSSGLIAIFYYFFSFNEELFIFTLWAFVCGILLFDVIRLSFPVINNLVYKYFAYLFIDREKDKINSASYYFFGVLFCIYFFPVEVAVSAMLFLSFGDTAASFVGIHWGKRKLIGKKSIEGSLACLFTCLILAIFFLPVHIAIIGAIIATLTEVLPWDLDDNLTVPVFSGIIMTLFY